MVKLSFQIERIGELRQTIERLLGGVLAWVAPGSAVFIKPNLTYPRYLPGVTTTPAVLETMLEVLKDRGVQRICVGEGEGGYNTFRMRDTFESYGAATWAKRFGAEFAVVNEWPSMQVSVSNRHGAYTARFPKALRDEFDGTISVPVPKVHSMTVMSGAVKNQWGLVQDGMRLRLHLALPELLYEFHRQIQPIGVLIDGTYGLTRNGPMLEGEPIQLGWMAAASDVWTADMALTAIMGIDARSVPYLRYGLERGVAYDDTAATLAPFVDSRFYLKLNTWNRAARLTWSSPILNHLVYFSGASTILHRLMYKLRDAPADLSVRGRDWS